MGIVRLGYWHQFLGLLCGGKRVFNVTRCAAWVVWVIIAIQAVVFASKVAAQTTPTCNSASITGVWQDNGTLIRVVVSGVSNATEVDVPTFNPNDPSKPVVWYPAVDDGYGTWIADIRPAPPADSGWYASHVYLHNGPLRNVFCGAVNTIRPAEQVPTCASFGAEWKQGGALLRVYVYGVTNAKSVSTPTWSTANGQDDLPQPWQAALNYGNGIWIADITPLTIENGPYAVHIYMDTASQAGYFCGGFQIDRLIQPPPQCASATASCADASRFASGPDSFARHQEPTSAFLAVRIGVRTSVV